MKKWKKLSGGMNGKHRKKGIGVACQYIPECCFMQQCPVQKEVDAYFESVEEEEEPRMKNLTGKNGYGELSSGVFA